MMPDYIYPYSNLTEELYLIILETTVHSLITEIVYENPNIRYGFQHDQAPPHYSRQV